MATVGYNREIYLKDLVTLEQMDIQFVPGELNASDETMWVGINSPGRNNPFYHYTGGEDILNFQLDLYAAEENREDVLRRLKWLKSLTRADGYNNEPHPVKLIWGNILFNDAVWIVAAAPYKMTMFDGSKSMLPIQAYVDLTLKRVTPENINWAFIRNLKT